MSILYHGTNGLSIIFASEEHRDEPALELQILNNGSKESKRSCLSQIQVANLIPYLQRFVATGTIEEV